MFLSRNCWCHSFLHTKPGTVQQQSNSTNDYICITTITFFFSSKLWCDDISKYQDRRWNLHSENLSREKLGVMRKLPWHFAFDFAFFVLNCPFLRCHRLPMHYINYVYYEANRGLSPRKLLFMSRAKTKLAWTYFNVFFFWGGGGAYVLY